MADTSATHALSGIKVVDASRVLAGPLCAQILGDHGASVIKVEPPQGDDTRRWGPPFKDGSASYFHGLNRNKRAITLDLSSDGGRDVLLRLLKDADVFVENFKSGTMQRWGIGYDEFLAARFPRLVYCQVTGFGADGPLGGMPGYDAVLQAMSGVMSINGDPDKGATRVGAPIVDIATGMNAAIGVLAALMERERSGKGQLIDCGLYDTGIALLHPHVANYLLDGKTPRLMGSAHPNVVPYDKFQTRSCEIFLGIGNDGQFRKLCATLAMPELADDPRFVTGAKRNANRDDLTPILARALKLSDGHALCGELLNNGVPAGPVQNIAEVMAHPHTAHRKMKVALGDDEFAGIPVKLSRTPGSVRAGPPCAGEHTRDILQEAGYSDDEVSDLIDAGVAADSQLGSNEA